VTQIEFPIFEDTSWMKAAACRGQANRRGDFDQFFGPPKQGGSSTLVMEGRAFCASCEVAHDCLSYAERHDVASGVWGGMTERDRSRFFNRYSTSTPAGRYHHREYLLDLRHRLQKKGVLGGQDESQGSRRAS
jgi:hypothetical protein